MERKDAIKRRIQELMERKGIDYKTLAEASGIPLRSVYRIATGMSNNPSVFYIMQICDGLGVSLDEFFEAEYFAEFRNPRA
ncbi:MAG: helix-turn-helix transcriptional regulator [Agathobacter sp.]|nr:helix-turn-helix transcriptional regulator [Agathobacter sp.]